MSDGLNCFKGGANERGTVKRGFGTIPFRSKDGELPRHRWKVQIVMMPRTWMHPESNDCWVQRISLAAPLAEVNGNPLSSFSVGF